jgi:glycine/D-amino acid oxidase-like deaminating enzyme/nitrite reductase/ring-hydroxylating ferredoxin subunit
LEQLNYFLVCHVEQKEEFDMRRSPRESISPWQDLDTRQMVCPPLRANIKTDVCVIGAGISGLTTAFLLQKEGKSVVIVDAWEVGAGETGRTTAHLTAVLDDRFYNIENVFGEENARLAADSHRAAIDLIESIVKDNNIECDFERLDGYLVALDAEQERDLKRETEACKRANFKQELLSKVPLPNIKAGPALRFFSQGTFHITKYLQGLAKIFQDRGGQIYTRSRIVEVKGGKEPWAKTEDGYRINAKSIVVATNTPINDWVKMHTKQAAYRTYVIAFKIPKDAYLPFLLWDMSNPYHYARIVHGDKEDLLVIGGEDHKTGQANDAENRYKKLEEWSREHFEVLGPIAYRWSGQVMEPVDYLAFIGRNPMDENVYIVTGDSGNGMTHGTLAGILITDLIQGRANSWEKIYEPLRKSIQTAPTYIKENANFVGCMISDWVAPSEVKNVEDIATNEGAIMRDGVSKVAVFKDEKGVFHKCSAVCTHLGCVVQWNSGEKSWDCPCHGSRFDPEGHILNAPAIKPLEEHFEVRDIKPEGKYGVGRQG